MRLLVLAITLVFIALLGTLTLIDIVHYGVTLLGIVAVLVVLLFMIGIVGALREPPKQ